MTRASEQYVVNACMVIFLSFALALLIWLTPFPWWANVAIDFGCFCFVVGAIVSLRGWDAA